MYSVSCGPLKSAYGREEEQEEQIFSAYESEHSISGGEQDKPEFRSSTRLSFVVGRLQNCDTKILCFDALLFCFYLQEN